ncbi:hypothetical protein [Actinomadura sp. HBU206391]|uniref:hypothetical protein n=1 Tax=Actinomadura sp. HBU206391 TaxID=2731692 RepID=UPI00164F3D35|nr:hypothetical protein [Actinomadura sp. HBU206391]MBC6457404.1 hypothetical protein [Actinomadura sp. HBU206391]
MHKQMYWVDGPPGPVCATDRDLYLRLVGAGREMTTAGRSLDEFLRAWWLVSRPMAARVRLDADTVAAMVTAALRPAWRTTSYALADAPAVHADWEQVVLSQIADLADFAEADLLRTVGTAVGTVGTGAPAADMDAPRPSGSVRATGVRWYNLDPRAYLASGMAGSLLRRGDAVGSCSDVPGPVTPATPEAGPGKGRPGTLSWADLVHVSICGQEYQEQAM